MSSSRVDIQVANATGVCVTDDHLVVDLDDGRSISLPLSWYPRLYHGTPPERASYRLIGGGEGVHWPDLDEDLRVEDLLAGRRSQESQASLENWLSARSRS
ncbi:MAG: DUF2442 domain-containing protein [Spirochaetaceae bacterium]|nr:MAG: DUF2442 domain-containing protein [Spirochaetaceae bacterium]